MDIDRGLEMKILYNPTEDPIKIVRCYFCTSASQLDCRYFEIKLWSGFYLYHGCTEGTLVLPEVEENKPWILKIYRKNAQLMIDLNEVNILKHYITVRSCLEFWIAGHISKVKFDTISENLVTHYRIAARQDGEEEEESEDDEDFTGKIYVFKLSVSEGGYKGGTDLTGKGDLAGKEYTKL